MSQVAALQNELYSDVPRHQAIHDEPSYVDGTTQRVLGPYVRQAFTKLKDYYQEKIGQIPSFKDVRVALDSLPVYVSRISKRIRGVIHGMYNPETAEVVINRDSVELPGVPDTDLKRELRKYDMTEIPQNVVTHELGHHAQRETGAIRRYTNKLRIPYLVRMLIEGGNTDITEEVTGEPQRTYPHERKIFRKLRELYGLKRAALGDVPIGVGAQPAYALALAYRRIAYAR